MGNQYAAAAQTHCQHAPTADSGSVTSDEDDAVESRLPQRFSPINIPGEKIDPPQMGNKGGVWEISIQGGRVHCKCVTIPARQDRNGHIMCDIIPLHLFIPDGALTTEYH